MRIRSFPVILFLVLSSLGVLPLRAQQNTPVASDWPQFRGIHRNGRVPALPRSMPALKLLWKQAVSPGESDSTTEPCDAGIAVAHGSVVVPDHDEKNDYYRCYDAEKGTPAWTRTFPNNREMEYGAGPRATPLIDRNKVFVLSAFGDLYCLELKTGKTVWEKNFSKDYGAKRVPKWGYSSSPLIAAGKLIVNPGGKAAIAALDPETGNTLWEGEGGRSNYASFLAGTFGGVEQVIGHDDAGLNGWDLATGKRLWSVPMEQGDGFIVPTPVNVGGKVLVTDAHNESQLFGFGKDGTIVKEPLAKSEDIAPEVITPVAVGDLVLGVSKKLVCLDAADGLNTLWASKNEPTFRGDCHLIIANDVGLAFSNKGMLVLFSFDREGVKVLGKKKVSERTLMHPSVVGNRLYLRDSAWLYCYDLKP
jgi:outer membrane protein assembly factor BamB